ncbi:hypothetical protein CEXT_607501 [Caerostris extrusa]|uniref:Uncharacterized protein n=1 Tax=Caerostris extrusa TaxID=172846 RepID=A0AAV4UGW7_CAEEX|nr:hypothetical protein CEXT_607501 [Caerostris extrusa]
MRERKKEKKKELPELAYFQNASAQNGLEMEGLLDAFYRLGWRVCATKGRESPPLEEKISLFKLGFEEPKSFVLQHFKFNNPIVGL